MVLCGCLKKHYTRRKSRGLQNWLRAAPLGSWLRSDNICFRTAPSKNRGSWLRLRSAKNFGSWLRSWLRSQIIWLWFGSGAKVLLRDGSGAKILLRDGSRAKTILAPLRLRSVQKWWLLALASLHQKCWLLAPLSLRSAEPIRVLRSEPILKTPRRNLFILLSSNFTPI